MPKRLLLISERFAPDLGGVARSASRTADAIAELGIEVHVLAWTRTLPAGQLASHDERRSSAGAPPIIVHRLGLFANLDFSLQHTLTVLEALHRQSPFDGVWGHYLYPAGYLAAWFAGWIGVPATVSARGNDVDMLMFPPGDFARLQWTLERSRVVTAVSANLARKIKLLASRECPVLVLPNSVDGTLFAPAEPDAALRASLGILPEEAILGFSGELRHKKGLTALLAALLEVRQSRPACLLVIGEVRIREQAALATFAAEHPDDRSRIIVTGHLEDPDDIVRHLQLCDVFLQPSLWDGLPNAVLEAMACERVVIASDAGGIPEIIKHGKSGFCIPRLELHRLGEAIREVLDLPLERRRAIGKSARRRMLEAFGPDQESSGLKAVFDELWGEW